MSRKRDVRRRGILRRRLFEVLEARRARRVAGSNPAPKRVDEEKKRKEDELPPEFKPLERKYGKTMARAAYKFIENYLNSMFGEEE